MPAFALHRGDGDRASGEPRPAKLRERVAAGDECAYAGRVAEHLVEGGDCEVGLDCREVEPVGGHERGGVEHDVPALRTRDLDPFERVLHAAEVRLRRVGEQPRGTGIAAARIESAHHEVFVEPKIRLANRYVGDICTATTCELADPVDGVVVVVAEQVARAGLERVRLTHQLQRVAGVLREDDVVFLRICREELVHRFTRLVHVLSRGQRRGVV